MSTKIQPGGHDHAGHGGNGEPYHDTVTFEPRDINVVTVAKQLVYLAITIVISLLICVPILHFFTHMAIEGDTPMAPVRSSMHMQPCDQDAAPPEPRLQGVPCHENDGQQDLREKLAQDNTENDSTHWIDQSAGTVKIPVQDAMKIIAEKGNTAASTPAKTAPEKKK
jgi:hypothetical protein